MQRGFLSTLYTNSNKKTDASGCTAMERPFDLLGCGNVLDSVLHFRVFTVFPDGLYRDAILGLHLGQ